MLYLLLALFTAAIVAVDQLTKYLAAANLVGKTVTLIPGWLQLHYITNDGMALSLLRGARWLFVVMTAVYLAVVIYVLVKKWFKKTPELWCIAAITGGAIGNFIDRISTGLVIDMICIPWFSTFNVADLFITFGALDVADALNSGKLAAAGLDVVYTEPIRPDNPLLTAKNCIITPHISWAPKESRQRIMDATAENIRAFLAGTPQNVVNH